MSCAVQIAYFAVDVADHARAAEREQLVPHLTQALTDLIRTAQEEGRIPQVDHFTIERAMAVVDHRLDQLVTLAPADR